MLEFGLGTIADAEWLTERAEHRSYDQLRRLYGRQHGVSPYEFYLADLLKREGAPELWPQFQFGGKRLDFFVPAARAVIEVDGYHHLVEANQLKDRELDRLVEAIGFIIFRITTADLEERGPTLARKLGKALRERAQCYADIEAVYHWRTDGRTKRDWPPDVPDPRSR